MKRKNWISFFLVVSQNYRGSAITPKHLSQLGHEHMAYSNVPPAGFWPVSKAIFGAENSFAHSGQIVMMSLQINGLKYVILFSLA